MTRQSIVSPEAGNTREIEMAAKTRREGVRRGMQFLPRRENFRCHFCRSYHSRLPNANRAYFVELNLTRILCIISDERRKMTIIALTLINTRIFNVREIERRKHFIDSTRLSNTVSKETLLILRLI